MNDILDLYADRIAPDPNSGCWLWTGSTCSGGYGNLQRDGQWLYAHRLSFELINGPITAPVIRHTCDTPACVNPAHLLAGTHKDNARDMDERGRRKPAIGEAASKSRLSERQVLNARRRAAAGETVANMLPDFPVDWTALDKAIRGETWGHLPGAVPAPVRGTGKGAERGAKNAFAVLTETDVREIRRRLVSGAGVRALARELGVSASTISSIKNGRNWGWLS